MRFVVDLKEGEGVGQVKTESYPREGLKLAALCVRTSGQEEGWGVGGGAGA